MPKKNMGLKRKNLTGYMGGGVFKSKAPVSSSFRGGGATEVGTEKKVQSYKEYAKKMFGGGSLQTQTPMPAGATKTSLVVRDRPTRGVRIPKVVGHAPLTGGPGFQPTKADDRGYATGDSTSEKRARRKSGENPNKGRGVITVKPPGKPPIKGKIKTPAFQPTKADDRGMYGGGTLDSMRKKIIGIKKDRGLTAKSGARKGMTKKKATGRGGR